MTWPTDIEHRDGVPWHRAPKPRRLHRHRWQTRGWVRLSYIERCACGAANEGDGRWFYIGRDKPRTRMI